MSMTEQHKDIVRQLRSIGEFPRVYIQQIAPNGFNITVASTERPSPGQTIAATFNVHDLLSIVRGVNES